jgi:hypothetical protein
MPGFTMGGWSRSNSLASVFICSPSNQFIWGGGPKCARKWHCYMHWKEEYQKPELQLLKAGWAYSWERLNYRLNVQCYKLSSWQSNTLQIKNLIHSMIWKVLKLCHFWLPWQQTVEFMLHEQKLCSWSWMSEQSFPLVHCGYSYE